MQKIAKEKTAKDNFYENFMKEKRNQFHGKKTEIANSLE